MSRASKAARASLGGARRRRGPAPPAGSRRRRRAMSNRPWWIDLVKAVVIVNLLLGMFAYMTWSKPEAARPHAALRYGPNRAGPFGLLQPIADLVKLIEKSFYPATAVEILYIGPSHLGRLALAAFAVIPWGAGWTVGGYDVSGAVVDVTDLTVLIFRNRLAPGSTASSSAAGPRFRRVARFDADARAARLVRGRPGPLSVLGVVLMAGSLAHGHRRRAGGHGLVRRAAARRVAGLLRGGHR